ncbi:MAG: hypothetical protein ACJ73D_01680 [Pyrinomonadaceae bacterium]
MKKLRIVLLAILLSTLCSCSPAEPTKGAVNSASSAPQAANIGVNATNSGAKIEITAGGPADTVRAFYQKLKEKKFREAIYMTNLRPAVEGLTDAELQDFSLDFEQLAGQVPAQLEINGEIVTGDSATVTVNLPNADTGKPEVQPIKLRQQNGLWVIQSVDDTAAARIKKEGKGYLYNVRIETHQEEARTMLDRIAKAEMVQAAQNNGQYSDLNALVAAGLLPADVKTNTSTGYNYEVLIAADKKSYSATAYPSQYSKTGKLSFLVELDAKGASHLTSRDNGGKPVKK